MMNIYQLSNKIMLQKQIQGASCILNINLFKFWISKYFLFIILSDTLKAQLYNLSLLK